MKKTKVTRNREIMQGMDFFGINHEWYESMKNATGSADNLHRIFELALTQETVKTGIVSTGEYFQIVKVGFFNVTIKLSNIRGVIRTKTIPLNQIIGWVK